MSGLVKFLPLDKNFNLKMDGRRVPPFVFSFAFHMTDSTQFQKFWPVCASPTGCSIRHFEPAFQCLYILPATLSSPQLTFATVVISLFYNVIFLVAIDCSCLLVSIASSQQHLNSGEHATPWNRVLIRIARLSKKRAQITPLISFATES